MNSSTSYRLGLALVTGSAIVWSTAGLFTRIIAADTPTTLFWRGMFGTIGIILFMLARNYRTFLLEVAGMGWRGWLYATVSGASMLVFITSLRLTSVAHVAIIYATVPFIAGGGAWLLLGERMGLGAVLASFGALAGVIVMVGLGHGEGSLLGDGLALIMTIGMAAIMLLGRHFTGVPMLAAAGLSALLSALAVAPLSHVLSVSAADMVALAAFGMVNSGLGLAMFTIGSRLLPAAETGLIGALDAPLAPIWVWLIFSETPDRATMLGGAIVFAAVGVHVLAGFRGRKTRSEIEV